MSGIIDSVVVAADWSTMGIGGSVADTCRYLYIFIDIYRYLQTFLNSGGSWSEERRSGIHIDVKDIVVGHL